MSLSIAVLLAAAACFLATLLAVRFGKRVIPFLLSFGLVLTAGVPIGIVVAFVDLELGIDVFVWSALVLIAYYAAILAIGFMSWMFFSFVVGPIGMVWVGISGILNSLKK